MRAAYVCPMVACLLWAAGAAYAQGDGAETPSLLPLPSFSPPPLARGPSDPVALEARRNARAVAWNNSEPTPAAVPPGGYFWDEPTEVMPATSRSGIRVVPGNPVPANDPVFAIEMMPGSCAAGSCGIGSCNMGPNCCLLGGSPFAQALNTNGMPPLNLYGLQFRPSYWFGSLAGLVMTRDAPNALSTTFNSSNVNTNLLDTGQARANWAGGGQVMFGRWWGPQAYGMQFIYWGLGPMTGSANVVDPNFQLSTPFNLGNVNIGHQSATFYFDNAHEHAVWRKDGFNNFEWNAMRRATFGCCAPRLMFTGLAGLRYFRFQDGLIFGGVNSNNFSDAGGAFAAYLNTGVTNSLVGVQLGTRIDYFVLPRVRLYAQPMMGLFGNQVSMREHLYSGDGAQGFDVLARRSTASTLGQLDLGAGYQITPRFSAFAAYRLIGVTRVGLADNQIPPFWADQQGMQHIKTNGDLILHGVMMGAMWNF